MKSCNDEVDADASKCGDENDNNNEGDSDGNGNGQFRSGVPSQGCLIICLLISLIQVKKKSIPSFLVWLITDPRLYYPLHQEKDTKKWNQRQRKRGSVDVYLWKAVIDPSKLQVEDHPQFKGVCLVKTDGKISSPRCPGVILHSFQFIIFTFRLCLADHCSILSDIFYVKSA